MKRILLSILAFFVCSTLCVAQPVPAWVKHTPTPPRGSNYIFVWGEGVDNTPSKAKNKAFADAVRKGLFQIGATELSQQQITEIENEGLKAATKALQKKGIRECCSPDVIVLTHNVFKAYILLQIEYKYTEQTDFYNLPKDFDCYDPIFEKELAQWNRKFTNTIKHGDWTNHIAWSGFTVSYPFAISTGINGRHGKTVGFGWYANVGIGWRSVKVSEWETTSSYSDTYVPAENYYKNKPYFAYEAGVKFYPYKGAFLSLGYGTLGTLCEYAYSSFKEWQSATEAENELWKKQVNSGMIAKVGWDFIFADGLWYFSVNGGVGYDLTNKTWTPAFSASLIGLGGYINKK